MGEAMGADAIIFNEYPLPLEHCAREKPGTFFGTSPAGGLGWGLGAALGAKFAAPGKLVVATLGDGTYMFTNPTVSHWVATNQAADAHDHLQQQPLRRGAARNALDVQGRRCRRRRWPFPRRPRPAPPFEEFAEAHGGHGERVENPQDLPAALRRARDAVR